MNEKILRALVEAGAVKKIKITAEGSTIYVEAYTGSEVTTAKTIKGKLKTWSIIIYKCYVIRRVYQLYSIIGVIFIYC